MKFLLKYGTTAVLLLLCAVISWLTYEEQNPVSIDAQGAARQIVHDQAAVISNNTNVVVIGRDIANEQDFVEEAVASLAESGAKVVAQVNGDAGDVAKTFRDLNQNETRVDLLIGTEAIVKAKVVPALVTKYDNCARMQIVSPDRYRWPTFLTRSNLVNVADQISVTAILAAGMTFVIVAGGIDLSVGSVIALSSVIATLLIRDRLGAQDASPASMVLASACAIAICGLLGMSTGMFIEKIGVPAFIVTLATMMIARGTAQIFSEGQAVGFVPDSYSWLGRGTTLLGIPNPVILMLLVFGIAHVVLSNSVLGRYVYAIGGNREAAYLSGVPVRSVVVFTYTASGILAALGGVLFASTYKAGSSNYGVMMELHVIAAVVVGGTSLSGGRGTIPGTLMGAFIIAVIRNGMNLEKVEPFTQNVILGLVILAAATLDKLKEPLLKRA
ncbi:MAG: ABC transporter permease [Planctomycetales bacterium]|nr:ABC transporter permease [Planctomycetales bacterium]